MERTYLSIQGSYQTLFIALFKDNKKVATVSEKSIRSSSHFILMLETLLHEHDKTLGDLDFIAVDQGPGAFTSLRVTITYLNAFGFSTRIPIVGIDGLEALADQTYQHLIRQWPLKTMGESCKPLLKLDTFPTGVVTMLNAYGGEVYFGAYQFEQKNTVREMKSIFNATNVRIDKAPELLNNLFADTSIVISGNGAALYEKEISASFNGAAAFCLDELLVSSVDQIACMGLKTFEQQTKHTHKILPLYLKEQTFAVQKGV